MDLIKELFWGNVCPTDFSDNAILKNPEYKMTQKEFSKIYNELEKSLPPDMLELCNQAMELHTHISAVQEEETFKVGFTLGAQLIHACFYSE